MKNTRYSIPSDAELLASAMQSALRWEQTLVNGGGHKLSDRPDRKSKKRTNSGPTRDRAYNFLESNGDLIAYRIQGGELDGRRVDMSNDAVPATWYGDDYGTGRHYAHVEDASNAYKVERGDGRSARSGKVYRVNPTTGERTALGNKRGRKVMIPVWYTGEGMETAFHSDAPIVVNQKVE